MCIILCGCICIKKQLYFLTNFTTVNMFGREKKKKIKSVTCFYIGRGPRFPLGLRRFDITWESRWHALFLLERFIIILHDGLLFNNGRSIPFKLDRPRVWRLKFTLVLFCILLKAFLVWLMNRLLMLWACIIIIIFIMFNIIVIIIIMYISYTNRRRRMRKWPICGPCMRNI